VNECYLEIWDSLFIFLTEIMDAFEFDPFQVASIFANVLLPFNEIRRTQVCVYMGDSLVTVFHLGFWK